MIELRFGPDCEGVDAHTHDNQTDTFFVLEGEAEFLVGDETFRFGPGSYGAAPPGVVHGFRVVGDRELRMLDPYAEHGLRGADALEIGFGFRLVRAAAPTRGGRARPSSRSARSTTTPTTPRGRRRWTVRRHPATRTAAGRANERGDRRDLERHAADFAARRGFAYTVLEDGRIIGCVYVYPLHDGSADAQVSSWVTADRAELDRPLRAAVRAWLRDAWPFETVDYARLNDERPLDRPQHLRVAVQYVADGRDLEPLGSKRPGSDRGDSG